jgi:hypothetical protein
MSPFDDFSSFRLVSNWREILGRAWSVGWAAVSGLLSGLSSLLPYFDDKIPLPLFSLLTVLLPIGAGVTALFVIWARVSYQPSLSK